MRSIRIVIIFCLILVAIPALAREWISISALNDKVSFTYPPDWVVDERTDKQVTVSNHDEEVVFAEAFSVSEEPLSDKEKPMSLDAYVDDALSSMVEGMRVSEEDSMVVDSRKIITRNGHEICQLNLSLRLMGMYSLKVDFLVYKDDKNVILGFLTYDKARQASKGAIFQQLLESFRIN